MKLENQLNTGKFIKLTKHSLMSQ